MNDSKEVQVSEDTELTAEMTAFFKAMGFSDNILAGFGKAYGTSFYEYFRGMGVINPTNFTPEFLSKLRTSPYDIGSLVHYARLSCEVLNTLTSEMWVCSSQTP